MIGIFGGTFDPVHYGHIKPALFVKQVLNLSQLRFIPNRIPPHRETPWLSVEQRLSLLQSALQDYPDVLVDQRELNRQGSSFMVDTLKSLHDDFPDETLCLIIGMDAFFGITSWYQWTSLFDCCHLVVMTRPGFAQSQLEQQVTMDDYRFLVEKMTTDVAALTAEKSGWILLQSVPQLDISSTQIRADLQNHVDISQCLPKQVYQQLKRLNLHDN